MRKQIFDRRVLQPIIHGTVRFGLDGTQYEINLNAGHARELRDALARYVDAARRVASTARKGRRGSAGDLNAVEVRKWTKAQGIEVKRPRPGTR